MDTMTKALIPTIAVIGSLNYDLVSVVGRLPNGGETLASESFSTNPGGKGANQAVACARLGSGGDGSPGSVKVEMIGAVGDDEYGALLMKGLKGQGVNVGNVIIVPGENSGVAVIIVREILPSPVCTRRIMPLISVLTHICTSQVEKDTGENRIMINAGANGATGTSRSPLPPHLFESRLTRPSRPDLIVVQLEIPLPSVLSAISSAAASNVPVLLNPAPALKLPANVYKDIEILVVNETEAAMLSGVDFSSTSTSSTNASPTDNVTSADPSSSAPFLQSKAHEAISWFVKQGSRHVVVTLGASGAVFREDSPDATSPVRFVPAHKVHRVVDTTAAGDTFVGALAVSYVTQTKAEGIVFSLERAVQEAVVAAAWTVERRGTWEAMPLGLSTKTSAKAS